MQVVAVVMVQWLDYRLSYWYVPRHVPLLTEFFVLVKKPTINHEEEEEAGGGPSKRQVTVQTINHAKCHLLESSFALLIMLILYSITPRPRQVGNCSKSIKRDRKKVLLSQRKRHTRVEKAINQNKSRKTIQLLNKRLSRNVTASNDDDGDCI